MNQTFIDILQKLIAEQGKEALLNSAKCKAFLADYTKGEYKKESRFLLQALEAGAAKAIDTTQELPICKKQQTRVLREEYGLAEEIAADVVDTLALALRGEVKEKKLCKNCGKELADEWRTCPYCSTWVVGQKSVPEIPAVAQAEPPQEETPPEPERALPSVFMAPLMEEDTALSPSPIKKKHTKRNVLIAIAAGVFLLFAFLIILNASPYQVKTIANGTAIEITKYRGSKTEIQIPSRIRNLPVTAIGEYAFFNKQLTSVTIPDGVTTIANASFCRNQLTIVFIPNSVKTIGEIAFADNELIAVSISSNVTTIGTRAFENNQLASVTIPNSVKNIDYWAFDSDVKVTTTTSPQRPASDDFVRINGGTFMMGSPSNEQGHSSNESPQHQVTVNSFYMGKYEVTYKEYEEIIRPNSSDYKDGNKPKRYVNLFDVIEYCNRRSQREGLTPVYTKSGSGYKWNRNANGYRLPTEAEWEYACRAGTTTPWHSGTEAALGNYAWYSRNSNDDVHEVGKKLPNAFGLYDMHGNVWELCWDWYASYPNEAQTDPMGASSGSSLVIRGGWWRVDANIIRSAYRSYVKPDYRDSAIGFRLVRNVE